MNVEQDEGDGTLHVYPLFGKEHSASIECWCQPEQDPECPTLWLHHPEQ